MTMPRCDCRIWRSCRTLPARIAAGAVSDRTHSRSAFGDKCRGGPPLLDEDYLTLSTIHSAKGQEWKVVQVLNCIDGCMPSDMATGNADDIEEERRLLYVAMTRTRRLTLLLPQRFYVHQQRAHGDRHVYATRSRFLTNEVCERFSQETWYPRSAVPNSASVETAKLTCRLSCVTFGRRGCRPNRSSPTPPTLYFGAGPHQMTVSPNKSKS
jgi:hypothetical protein